MAVSCCGVLWCYYFSSTLIEYHSIVIKLEIRTNRSISSRRSHQCVRFSDSFFCIDRSEELLLLLLLLSVTRLFVLLIVVNQAQSLELLMMHTTIIQ
jgi:hypothetical protein